MNFFVDFLCYKMCFYNSLFCHLIASMGGAMKKRTSHLPQSSSTLSKPVIPAFASLLAPSSAPEFFFQWFCPDLALLHGSGPAASPSKYLREGLSFLPNLAPVKDQYSGKSLRKGELS